MSIGVSFSKILAKLGSDMKKPDAITVLDTEHWRDRVWQLPVSDLLFVGPRTAKKLKDRNVLTIGDLAHTDPKFLQSWFGKNGLDLWITANGEDRYRIKPDGYDEPIKSVGHGMPLPMPMRKTEISCDSVSTTRLPWLGRSGSLPFPAGNTNPC